MSSEWIQETLPVGLNLTNDLFSHEDHSAIVDKLVSAGLRIEEQLEDYQPADMREELIRLKEKCQPFMLLACFAGSLRIVDKEKKIFEVIPDLREQKIESDFDNYEFHSYWVSELSKSKLLKSDGATQIVLDVLSCYVSVVLSYFRLVGFSSVEEVDEAQIFCAQKVGDGGRRYEEYCKTYFLSHQDRSAYLNNLLSAINRSKNSLHQVDGAAVSSDIGFVYFVRNGELFKIGITENLLRRMGELAPDEILNSVRCSNFRELEREIHSAFKEVRLPQTEYFRLSEAQVQQVHRMIADRSVM